jgi:hypothetical protein
MSIFDQGSPVFSLRAVAIIKLPCVAFAADPAMEVTYSSSSLPNTLPVDRFMRCTRLQAKHITVS